ncbi:MAG: hypothetical protein KGP28_05730 [Bdellovibrionales bacterium]|nr:hypothetical protein [Bdellovibrionales bacterium]
MSTFATEISGVEFSFKDPEAEWVAWQNRIAAYENEIESRVRLLDQELLRTPQSELTRKRLGRLRAGAIQQRETVRQLLRPFYPMDQKLFDVSLALRSRIPTKQGLLNYASNILRDWSPWSAGENSNYLELVRPLLQDRSFDRAFVPGCGAGRFAYDLHQNFNVRETLALDQNPLLVLFGKLLCEGSEIEWVDFPINPASLQSACVVETCKAPAPVRDGLRFVLGDALNATFESKWFDLVLTPWLIDVIPESFDRFARRINFHMKPDGEWVNYGPLAFSFKNPRFQHSFDEVREILLDNGFEILAWGETCDTPYLKSPHQGGSRLETLFWFHAKKISHLDSPPPHQKLAPWIEEGTLPIPALPEFAQTAENSSVFAEVCALIDGNRSIRDLALHLNQKFGLSEPSAVLALKKFLSDLLEKQ